MSKIVSMSSGAIDPIAQTKRVFFRPDTDTTSILKVGHAVCYNSDIVGDHKERAGVVRPPTDEHLGGAGTAYAEGAQTYTGRLFIVERPTTENQQAFAGIVKCLGPKAGADGDMIEIFVPNGAVVPVWTDCDCEINQTILALEDDNYVLTTSGWGRPIGVAMEDVDRSSIPGLCWAKISDTQFIRQGTDNTPLTVANEEDTCVMLNRIYVESAQTAGSFNLVDFQGILNGTGGFGGGMVKFRAELNAVASDTCQCLSAGLTIDASGVTTIAGFTYCNSAIHAGIGTSGEPNLTNANLSCFSATYYADEDGGAPAYVHVLHIHAGASVPAPVFDGLFRVFNAGDISDYAGANGIAAAAGDIMIPVVIGTTTYYLVAFQDDDT